MAENLTTYLDNKLLEHSTGKAAYSAPSHTYLALYTVAPTKTTLGTEVSAGNYSRQQLTWGSASEGQISISTAVNFPTAGTASVNYGTVVAMGILDAVTGGNLLWFTTLSPTITVNSGESFKLVSGGITLSLS